MCIRDRNIRIATLNVGTLRGKEEEMVMLMIERGLDVLGVCETRLAGSGVRVLHHNYQLIYSGGRENRHGVGVIMSEEMSQRVSNIEQKNSRIMSVSIKTNGVNLSFIQVYAPQQGRPAGEREIFYQELQDVKNRVPFHKNVIVLGDINGHVGTCLLYTSPSPRD